MLHALAETTRHTPGWFIAVMWTLAVVTTGGALLALFAAWRRRGASGVEGRYAQASCLAIFAVPTLLLGLFFLSWAIGIS